MSGSDPDGDGLLERGEDRLADLEERFGLARLWLGGVGAGVVALILGSVLFPRTVYAKFVWQYFWGPVYADAKGARCVAWDGGAQTLGCGAGASGPLAYPGYTVVSEIGYAVVLVVMLAGVGLLLRGLPIERYRPGFYALVPFMFFGGALRVLEDANNYLVGAELSQAVPYPWNTLLISPLIYGTVFVLALSAVVVSVWLGERDLVEGYEYPLAGSGTVLLAGTLVALVALVPALERANEAYRSNPELGSPSVEAGQSLPLLSILGLVLVLTVVATGLVWYVIETRWPAVNEGTGLMGLPILFGQAVDGVANVVGLDWGNELGLTSDLGGKHPVNRAVVDITSQVLPPDVIAVTGDAWPFLLIKLAAAVFVISIFDEEVIEDTPRFSIMLLIAVVAVGLGPGTRDLLRMVFGV